MSDASPLKFYQTAPHPCSYLDNEEAITVFADPRVQIDTPLYSALVDSGFRRSGEHIYRPYCQNCQACISVRIPCQTFIANRQQRRINKKNHDLDVIQVDSIDTPEHYALYEQYINGRHSDGDMYPPQLKSYQDFLCAGHPSTRYYQFMLAGELVGITVSDDLDQGLSAVYSFYDVNLDKRSLGTYMILWQIEALKKIPKAYLYLGYWIKNSPKMNYKSTFRPLELYINQQWTTLL